MSIWQLMVIALILGVPTVVIYAVRREAKPREAGQGGSAMGEMAHCRGCGKELHRTAQHCPQCGAMQRTQRYKSKVSAGALAILLGGLGIHRFYLGQWWGVFYLLLCWTYVPAIVAVVEGLVFLLSDQERWDKTHNEGVPGGGTSTAGVVLVSVVGVFALVAIVGIFVGILAAIAIPAYQDYVMRAQVSDALYATEPLRQSIVQAAARSHSVASESLDSLAEQAVAASQYLADVQVESGGVIRVTMGKGAANLAGETVLLQPVRSEAGILWLCSEGSVAAKYRPSNCRE